MLYKPVEILRIGRGENSGKTSMDGFALDALLLINKTNFAITVSRSTLILEITLILMAKNGSSVRIVINGSTQIAKSKMVLRI